MKDIRITIEGDPKTGKTRTIAALMTALNTEDFKNTRFTITEMRWHLTQGYASAVGPDTVLEVK